MKELFKIFTRQVNAATADGYSDWDDGILYLADSAEEAKELYIDDLTDQLSFNVRETSQNEFGNPVDYQLEDGAQFQIGIF